MNNTTAILLCENETIYDKMLKYMNSGGSVEWQNYSYTFVRLFGYSNWRIVVLPEAVVLTLICNSLFLAVLSRPALRQGTFVFLSAMAIIEIISAVIRFTFFLIKYEIPIKTEFFDSHPWLCPLLYFLEPERLPRSLHLTLLTLIVALAVYRLLTVTKLHIIQQYCGSVKKVKVITAAIVLTFLPLHLSPFYYLVMPDPYVPTNNTECRILRNLIDINKLGHCALKVNLQIRDAIEVMISIMSFILLIILFIITCCLVTFLIRLQRERQSKFNRNTGSDLYGASLSLVILLITTILVETPGIIMGLHKLFNNNSSHKSIHQRAESNATLLLAHKVMEILTTFMYPAEFFIFCFGSSLFREELVDMLKCSKPKADKRSICSA